MRTLKVLLDQNVSFPLIIAVLHNDLRKFWYAYELLNYQGLSGGQISLKVWSLPPFMVAKKMNAVGNFTMDRLVRSFHLMTETDKKLKQRPAELQFQLLSDLIIGLINA